MQSRAAAVLPTPWELRNFNGMSFTRQATPETPSWNVVIVTTGIARRWFEDDLITARVYTLLPLLGQTKVLQRVLHGTTEGWC